jgi:hypothetical protein
MCSPRAEKDGGGRISERGGRRWSFGGGRRRSQVTAGFQCSPVDEKGMEGLRHGDVVLMATLVDVGEQPRRWTEAAASSAMAGSGARVVRQAEHRGKARGRLGRVTFIGHERDVTLVCTPREPVAAASWPCPPWTLATAGVWARMGFRKRARDCAGGSEW